MTIQLCGLTMPASMSSRASNYVFTPAEIIGRNGEGDAIEGAAGASVVWEWAHLDAQEWDFLYTTVLGGAPSLRSSVAGNTVVYDNQRQERAFDHAIVHRPQYRILSGTDYQGVTLLIDQLR